MNLRKIIRKTWTLGLLLFSFLACTNNNTKTADVAETPMEEEVTEGEKRARELARLEEIKISQDMTDTDKDYYVIKYVAVDEPTAVVTASEIDENDTKAVFTKNKSLEPVTPIEDIDSKVKNDETRNLPEVVVRYRTFGPDINRDRPPVFKEDCLSEDNVQVCAENALYEYIEANLDYPANALKKGHDGYEIVTFVVDKNGKIKPNIRTISKDNPCKGCTKAVVTVIEEMPDWVPALENGQPVSTEVTVPIRFKLIDN